MLLSLPGYFRHAIDTTITEYHILRIILLVALEFLGERGKIGGSLRWSYWRYISCVAWACSLSNNINILIEIWHEWISNTRCPSSVKGGSVLLYYTS